MDDNPDRDQDDDTAEDTDPAAVPPIVARAEAVARAAGFPLVDDTRTVPSCCSADTGRLLAMLVAGCRGGRIGEIGTGTGYGTAWMVSALAPDATIVTVELDPGRAAGSRDLFAGDDRVTVIEGDAEPVIRAQGPYDLLFVDGGAFGHDVGSLRSLIGLVPVGGRLVVDDLTPTAALPPDSPFLRHDPKREVFLATPSLRGVEVVAPDLRESALVATRVS